MEELYSSFYKAVLENQTNLSEQCLKNQNHVGYTPKYIKTKPTMEDLLPVYSWKKKKIVNKI